MASPIFIVGLGNPGDIYSNTRHNIGFSIVDKLADSFNIFWKFNKKGFYVTFTKRYNRMIYLLKPQLYMNKSGVGIKIFKNFYKFKKILNLLIIHDEINLDLCKTKFIDNEKNFTTHKGVLNIVQELKLKKFFRLQIGIKFLDYFLKVRLSDYVLKNFSKIELNLIKNKIGIIVKNLHKFLKDWK
jgi:PTH1 family peptidyl-tRNA hydrolase